MSSACREQAALGSKRRAIERERDGRLGELDEEAITVLIDLLAVLPAAAHHSVAINFERGEPTEIRGTVTEVHMRNPHSQYVVAVPAADGTVTEWQASPVLTHTYAAEGRHEARFQAALEMAPTYVEAMSNLGWIAAWRGDVAGAQAWYERALALDPAYPHVHRRIADLYYGRKDWRRALEYYERVLRALPRYFEVLIQTGNAARFAVFASGDTCNPIAASYRVRLAHFRRAARLRRPGSRRSRRSRVLTSCPS